MWTTLRNLAITFMLLGIILLTLFLLIPEPNYEDFTQETIVIQSFRFIPYARGADVFWLESDKNDTYRICEKNIDSQLQLRLKAGLHVDIKYYRDSVFQNNNIKEMSADGSMLVTYQDHSKSDLTIMIIVVIFLELLGAGFLWAGIAYRKSSHYTNEKTNELQERSRLNKREKLQH